LRSVSDLLVLCYHAISEHWPADFAVTPAALERQLQHVVDRGYRGVTFTAAVTSPDPGRVVAVTFDDAFRSVLELAVPILDRLGLPATMFAPTAYVGTEQPMAWPGIDEWLDSPYSSELLPLSWEELRELSDAGWEIGSHSHTHPRLTQLDDAELGRELRDSKQECERQLARPCTSIAYPFGDVEERVVSAAARNGYRVGAALEVRSVQPLAWPRLSVTREDSIARFRRQASPIVRRLRISPVGSTADRAYALLQQLRRVTHGSITRK
jgi:peptidoglycan/xylan/chitin deacetylase (PgdA/CDA1 family)